MIWVVVVEAQVDGYGCRTVACYMRRDEACRDAAANAVAQQIGQRASQRNVLGREVTRLDVLRRGLLHRSIVHILCADAPRGALLIGLDERCRGRRGALHIGHQVQVQRLVGHVADECGIVEYHGGVAISQRDVVAAQRSHMGANGQAQEAIHLLALLGQHVRDCQDGH